MTINDRLLAALAGIGVTHYCEEHNDFEPPSDAEVDDFLRELAAQGLAVVPVEPTEEMVKSGQEAGWSERDIRNGWASAAEVYKAMIGAITSP